MDAVAEIKEKINIVDLINSYTPLKRAGKNYKARCPFHSEKTPSFMVSDELQTYRCFGCGKSGDIFNFVMEMEGVEFSDALKLLAEKAGVEVKHNPQDSKNKSQRSKIVEMNKLAQKFYSHLLTKHEYGKKALEYLKNRGATAETIREFKLGYAPKSWDSLSKLLTSKGYSPREIVEAGLGRFRKDEKNTYDMFRGRLMFPLLDHMGACIGFAGRALESDQEPKYINTSETPIFHKEKFLFGLNLAKSHIRQKKEAIIVEGEFDMISPYQKGFKNIVASKGTALTPGQVNLVKRYADTAVLIFDNDAAGADAIVRGIDVIQNLGLNLKIATLPKDSKDPDALVQKSPEKFDESVKNSTPLWDYYFVYAKNKFNWDDAFDRKKASDFLLSKIKRIEDEVVKSQYIKKFAEIFDVDEKAAIEQMQKTHINMENPLPQASDGSQGIVVRGDNVLKRESQLEAYFLSLLTKLEPENIAFFADSVDSDYFLDPELAGLLLRIKKEVKSNKTLEIKPFYDKLMDSRPETHKLFQTIYLFDIKEDLYDPKRLSDEIASVIHRIKSAYFHRKIAEKTKAMRKAESISDKPTVEELVKEVQQYTRELSDLET